MTMTYSQALKAVANDWRALAHAIREEDAYANHVTEERKQKNLEEALIFADDIEAGKISGNFTIAQRLDQYIIGAQA